MPSGTIQDLSARVKRLAEDVERGMALKVKAAVLSTAEFVVNETPVDTGAARSAWAARIGSRPTGRFEPFSPLPELHDKLATFLAGRKDEAVNAEGVMAQVESSLRYYDGTKRVYLSNNVKGEDGDHYLFKLDKIPGYTLQSQPYFVALAGKIGRDAARKVRVLRG